MSTTRNLRNGLLAACVPLPSVIFYCTFLHRCPPPPTSANGLWGRVCSWCFLHPIGLINLLFFLNVDVLFWIISLVQRSTWLIDPYWTILPVLMVHFYAVHPHSLSDRMRSRVVLILTWLWSIRLTHSYFRRENWQWGQREDWRFANMRKENPKRWWWLSFFIVYVSQHCFLVGICLPMFTIHNSKEQWSTCDAVVTIVCTLGIVIGYFSDTQLHQFVSKNNLYKKMGFAPTPVLDKGLWYYSSHPNYFGEQLWWWGLAGYSWIVGQRWAIVGTVVNSAVLAQVTLYVEEKMVSDESRAEAYRAYQQTTSCWIPWFKRRQRHAIIRKES